LFQLLHFVDWPPAAAGPGRDAMVIGVLGDSPMHAALQAIAGRQAQGRTLVVRVLRELRAPGDLHVLFVSAHEKPRTAGLLRMLHGASVLTIGETDGFARLGGMINFILVEGKVAFEVNPRAIEEASLRISSKVLRLARIVEGPG
jgi:hypothetical protein